MVGGRYGLVFEITRGIKENLSLTKLGCTMPIGWYLSADTGVVCVLLDDPEMLGWRRVDLIRVTFQGQNYG
jgi:hypothetical protein